MKKQIISLAIAALAFTSFTSFAQVPAAGQKADKVAGVSCNDCPKAKNPFEGLNLTAEQQSKLEALASERKAARDNEKKVARENRSKEKANKMATRRTARKAELDKIKGILTPEQYVTYLENLVLDGKGAKHAKHDRGRKDNRMGKKDGKGRNVQKGQRDQRGQRPSQGNPSASKK